jgi:hypothetical protein
MHFSCKLTFYLKGARMFDVFKRFENFSFQSSFSSNEFGYLAQRMTSKLHSKNIYPLPQRAEKIPTAIQAPVQTKSLHSNITQLENSLERLNSFISEIENF